MPPRSASLRAGCTGFVHSTLHFRAGLSHAAPSGLRCGDSVLPELWAGEGCVRIQPSASASFRAGSAGLAPCLPVFPSAKSAGLLSGRPSGAERWWIVHRDQRPIVHPRSDTGDGGQGSAVPFGFAQGRLLKRRSSTAGFAKRGGNALRGPWVRRGERGPSTPQTDS